MTNVTITPIAQCELRVVEQITKVYVMKAVAFAAVTSLVLLFVWGGWTSCASAIIEQLKAQKVAA